MVLRPPIPHWRSPRPADLAPVARASPVLQQPEHAVEHRARFGPRPTASIRASALPERRFKDRSLGVSEVHAARHDASGPL